MMVSQALNTDLYQLTMAQAYFKTGLISEDACFYMHFRENPFKGGYAIACGMAQLVDLIADFAFTSEELSWLATLTTPADTPLFEQDFLDALGALSLTLDVDAVPEGTVIFPYEPIIRVIGPIMQCQLIETALLNQVNYQILIATKAARVCQAAEGPVAEFGLRRAPGPAGGIYASRAAIIGGCSSTSDVAAGRLFDLPVSGTHAHSWVMAHPDELTAFRAFAEVSPENCVLLVDTYDTIAGVRNAMTVAHEMESRGQRLSGIRIDSGDLAWLSIQARGLLDAAGLEYVQIIASNDLDEQTIASLREQGARIDAWGVGTKLVTAYDQPALPGVYKLSATRACTERAWQPHIKVSEQSRKSTFPGILSLRRYFDADGIMIGDMVYDQELPPTDDLIIDPHDDLRRKDLSGGRAINLLEPLARNGVIVWQSVSAREAQTHTRTSLGQLHLSNRRFLNPHSYPVGLDAQLHEQRDRLIRKARGFKV
ncbi:MAG: nicotinate phosphoribosyltransferase [Coriobacteriales bacterium]|jgi:nicotinate phosphoribosyltransferase|nr:nicotinate phosphoribosyltransferase [Coriobacteriales bacterium]